MPSLEHFAISFPNDRMPRVCPMCRDVFTPLSPRQRYCGMKPHCRQTRDDRKQRVRAHRNRTQARKKAKPPERICREPSCDRVFLPHTWGTFYCPEHRKRAARRSRLGHYPLTQAKLAVKRHINILITHIAQAYLSQSDNQQSQEYKFWNSLKKHCQTMASNMWNQWAAKTLTTSHISLLMKSKTPSKQLLLLPLLDRTFQTYRLTLSPNCDWNIITSHIKSLPLEVISTGLKGISEV